MNLGVCVCVCVCVCAYSVHVCAGTCMGVHLGAKVVKSDVRVNYIPLFCCVQCI